MQEHRAYYLSRPRLKKTYDNEIFILFWEYSEDTDS